MTDQVVSIRLDADASTVQAASAKAETALKSLYNTLNAGAPAARSMSVETQRYVEQIDGAQRTLRTTQDQFQAVSDALENQEISANEATRAFQAIEAAAGAAAKGEEGLSLSTVGARRELVVLGHEIISGNFSRIPGSLMVLGERMGGLSLSLMGTAGAFAAVGYGAYELVEHIREVDQEVKGLSGDMSAIGKGAQNTPTQVEAWLDRIRDKYGLTRKEALSLGEAMRGLNASEADQSALEKYAVTLAKMAPAEGGVEKVSKSFATAWDGGADAVEKLGLQLRALNEDDLKALDTARQQHDVAAARVVMLQMLERRLLGIADAQQAVKNAARDEGAHNRIGFSKDDWGVDQTRSTAAKGQLQTAMANQGPDQNQVEEFQKDQFGPQQLQRQLQAQAAIWTEGRAALLAKEVEAWQQLIQTGNLGAEALTEAQRQLNTAQAALRQQNSADAVANARDGLASQAAVTDQGRAQRLQAQIAADRELLASTTLTVEDRKGVQRDLNAALAQLRQQDSADAIAQSRAQLAEQAAVGSQTRAQQLQAQISADEQLLASGKLTADARLGVERELNLAKASLAHEQAAEGLRTLQEEVTVARAGSQERIALLQQELAYAKAHFGAMSTEAKDAQTALTAAVREGQKEREGIEREANNTSIQLSKIATEAERDRLEAEVQAGRITEAQKIASLKRLADAEYEQNLEMLIEQRAALTEGTLAWQQAQDKIDVLTATHTAQLAKYADQTATANAKAAQASARAWESALAPVERAWDSSLTGWIQGTQTLQQAMAKMGTAILAEEITTDTKWLSHKLLVNAMGLASDKSTAQGGLLAYLLADRSKTVSATAAEATRTASTATGVATRTATTATESSSFIGRLGSMIAGWLGLETGKTAATAAGVTDRAIADKAEAIAETTKAEGEIQIAAAVAGANAYAAYAAVPPVAAAMAAEAVGAVQAFNSMLAVGGGLASAAGGWGQVPYDGAITELHKNEMVLPASIASPLRAAVTTWRNPPANLVANQNGAAAAAPAATGGQAGGDVHLHVNAMDTKSVAQFFQANKGPLADALKAAHRNGKR